MKDFSIISRSYDLRGIYPTEIDEDFYYRLGYAFATWSEAKKIALGYDARLSSVSLANAFSQGVYDAGVMIVQIGLCSSDMLSFTTCYYDDIEVGAMITASHNPKEYNGLKCVKHSGEPINMRSIGNVLTKIMEENISIRTKSKIDNEYRDVKDDWIQHILSFSETKDFSSLRVVVDGGNGAAGSFMDRLAEVVGFQMIPLYLEPDGNFPNHHPSPIEAKNREHARKKLLDERADVALLFDGDADRCVVLDNHGEMIISGIISTVIARSLLKKFPGSTICGNTVISHTLPDFVTKLGGKYQKEMVGHVYIKEAMSRNHDIIFSGEHSSHYYLRDNWNQDSGIIAGMIFLDLLVQSGKPCSEFVQEFTSYITLEETNFTVSDPKSVIRILGDRYKQEDHDFFDGITVRYPDGSWWNFRPSSNEPLLRLNMEARDKERFQELYEEISKTLAGFAVP